MVTWIDSKLTTHHQSKCEQPPAAITSCNNLLAPQSVPLINTQFQFPFPFPFPFLFVDKIYTQAKLENKLKSPDISNMWNKNVYGLLVVVVMTVAWMGGVRGEDSSSLGEQCAPKLTAVMTCVAFATGKEAAPQHKCCDSVKEMKESNPACLCFVIQQIHNGTNPTLQKMNIQESRLLQLPSACNIANASISDCPKLLKLPANSPDAAIFTNNGSIVSPASGRRPSSTTSSPMGSHAVKYDAIPLVVASSIFIPATLWLATSVF